jgi:hypothetical protein
MKVVASPSRPRRTVANASGPRCTLSEPLALWQDTYLVVGALISTAHRAAAFLGLGEELTVLDLWMQECQHRLLHVRPKDAQS